MKNLKSAGAGIVALLAITSSAAAAPADPETPACKMISMDTLKPLLGEPVVIRETNKATGGISNCFWKGSTKGAHVGVHYITFASQKIQGGTALQYFQQSERNQRERVGAQHYKTVNGLGQAAYMFDPTENPTRAVTITFLQNDDTVTLETYGIGATAAEALAKNIAAAMKR